MARAPRGSHLREEWSNIDQALKDVTIPTLQGEETLRLSDLDIAVCSTYILGAQTKRQAHEKYFNHKTHKAAGSAAFEFFKVPKRQTYCNYLRMMFRKEVELNTGKIGETIALALDTDLTSVINFSEGGIKNLEDLPMEALKLCGATIKYNGNGVAKEAVLTIPHKLKTVEAIKVLADIDPELLKQLKPEVTNVEVELDNFDD